MLEDSAELNDQNMAVIAIPKVSVVIPTLNEADNLRLLMPTLPSWISETIIVDGCSTDDTVLVARNFGETINVRIVMEPRKGKGLALHAGFIAAEGDIIVALDADCSMHPREILVLVSALLAGADFAKGSRFMQGGGTSDMTFVRMVGNWGLTQTVRLLYGGSFSDLCYGYFAFWRRHLDVLDPICKGFEVETFIKLQALKAKLRIAEVPSLESERIHGRSNLRATSDGLRILRTIIRERFVRPIRILEPRRVSAFGEQIALKPPVSASSVNNLIP
jgi:glycosyltransferase involved in cell wall biosynthesis